MPDTEPRAEVKGIIEVLDPASPVTTPIIQRSYAWGKDEVEDFWNDLSATRPSDRYHFLGLVVIDDSDHIQDGQQRLATAFIFIQVIRQLLARFAPNLNATEQQDLGTSRLEAALTERIEGSGQTATAPLAIGDGDQAFLLQPAVGLALTPESVQRLMFARGYLLAMLTEELEGLTNDADRVMRLWSWWKFVGSRACVVELRVTSQTAHNIFETLNTRGAELLTSDLVKSYLLSSLGSAKQGAGTHLWRNITSILSDARGKYETPLNEFLLHYWGSHHGQTTTAALFDKLQALVPRREADALRQLRSYERDSKLYAALRSHTHPYWSATFGSESARVKFAVRLINGLALKQLRYLLLAVLDEYPHGVTDERTRRRAQSEVIVWLAAWGVRGVVTARTGGKPAETAYLAAAREVREGSARTLDDIRRVFTNAGRTVGDDDFRLAFARYSFSATATKAILYELERRELGQHAPIGPLDDLTYEHVLPQDPGVIETTWPNFTREQHASHVQRLGNALLLVGVTNNRLRNKSWADKKRLILGHGVQQLPPTEAALTRRQWTWRIIEQRQRDMSQVAADLWPD